MNYDTDSEEYIRNIKLKTNFVVPTLNIREIKMKLEETVTPNTTDDETAYPWETLEPSASNRSSIPMVPPPTSPIIAQRRVPTEEDDDDNENWEDVHTSDDDSSFNEPTPRPKLTKVAKPKAVRFSDSFLKKLPSKAYVRKIIDFPEKNFKMVYYDGENAEAIKDLHLANKFARVYNLKSNRFPCKKYPRGGRKDKATTVGHALRLLKKSIANQQRYFNPEVEDEIHFTDENDEDRYFYQMQKDRQQNARTIEAKHKYFSYSQDKKFFIIFVDDSAEKKMTPFDKAIMKFNFNEQHPGVLVGKDRTFNSFEISEKFPNGKTSVVYNRGQNAFSCKTNNIVGRKVCQYEEIITMFDGKMLRIIVKQHTCGITL